jgi:hypothetical protein
MTMPMRPAMMGYGYGMGSGMGQENMYFGSPDPGKEIADVMLRSRASQRADEEATSLEEERKAQAKWREGQTAREDAEAPLRRTRDLVDLMGKGWRPGGGAPSTDGGVQAGLPPAGSDPGFQRRPLRTGDVDPGFQAHPSRTGDVDPGFQRPPAGIGGMGGGDRIPMPQGAAGMPGAFNPGTGTHNRADIDLSTYGGIGAMPYSATPEGRQSMSARELLESGLIPDLTPAGAIYLSQHPEHIAGMINAARGRGKDFDDWKRQWDYEGAHPHRLNPLEDKPTMTLSGALQEVDRQYGNGITNDAITRLGGVDKRMQLARQMMRPDFDPSHMPLAGTADRNARFTARTGRKLPAAGEEGGPQPGDEERATRNRQIAQVRDLIPPGADPDKVREVLRSHGLTDDEIQGVTTSPTKPRPRTAAVGAGGRF